ncbi:MAG TPA: MarR family transcriptional regulator [Candidatus Bathyarchaeia archaeon]|nr:MarR family transcriptional regulator [Candidatus Bathyarchaeia archaeon]
MILGLFRKSREKPSEDLAKLFFDSFSKKVSAMEAEVRVFQSGLSGLRISVDRGQVSDLVLLERLQGLEARIVECMEWVRRVAETVSARGVVRRTGTAEESRVEKPVLQEELVYERPVRTRILSPRGDLGSLPSITTPTELEALSLLAREGAKTAPEIGRLVGRSREHTARLMKKLLDEGYVLRDQARVPFRYSLSERVRQVFEEPQKTRAEEKESVSVPQT